MQPLHHEVIVCNAWALFIAGYETTSTALAYATFLLAKHPEVSTTQLKFFKKKMNDIPVIMQCKAAAH